MEKYQTEKEYREIFFQGFLDGDIAEKEYYATEFAFKKFINYCLKKVMFMFIMSL